MDWVLRIAIMLAAGLVTRHAVLRLGRRGAARHGFRIPALCAYATAGLLAAGARAGLEAWGRLEPTVVWILFGVVWGVVAGLLLPFSRRRPRDDAQAQNL